MADSQTTLKTLIISGNLVNWLEAFLIAKRSERLSPRTIEFYRGGLAHFFTFATLSGAKDIADIDALMIRRYLLTLENQGYLPGGVHAKWRSIRALFNWYELEDEQPDWINPVKKIKVKPPHLDPLDPADINAIRAILADCRVIMSKKDCRFLSARDKAIILMLLDTGLRASELLSLTVENINPITGVIWVLHGKGDKPRTVYIGRKARQALRGYLNETKPDAELWVGVTGEPLTRSGLRQMLIERAKRAGVKPPTPHGIRRLFALTMLRNGVDIYSLMLLMGHADIQILKRYLKLTQQDTLEAHIKGSPVEKLI